MVVSIFFLHHVVIISISSVWEEEKGKFREVLLSPFPSLCPHRSGVFSLQARSHLLPSQSTIRSTYPGLALLCHTNALLEDT